MESLVLIGQSLPFSHKQRRQCFENDLQIEPERPILNVEDVELYHLFERKAITTADLPEPCQSGLYIQPLTMPGFVAFDFVWNRRTGTDQTHFPLEDVEDLRKLVEAHVPKDLAHASQPGTVREFIIW